ncbi:hypothetical protein [Streptomyces lydicus]|uniref:hypothetical protein n=1 Tax=Streptomyces lydicus TaxID=47763 RepID=UPI00101165F8|nr:hypothetical protein [Streptomyces lydicus]MCZ1008550.1 hypothetical protein [Streptomyces lydicus]
MTVTDDLVNGSRAALGTALFTGGSATLAEAAGPAGAAGRIRRGDGLLGTTVKGAAGNVAGGLTADVWAGKDGSTLAWDAGTNALTGGLGNAQNHGVHHALEQHGSLGGENLGDRGKLADGAFRNVVDTGLNTGVYGAGSGIESDAQNLVEDEKKTAKGE